MKGSVVQNHDDGKTTQTRTKKGTKSRAKSAKTSSESIASNSTNAPGQKSILSATTSNINIGTSNATNMVTAPTTPTSSLFLNNNNNFENSSGANAGQGVPVDINIPIKNAQKNYVGLDARSIRTYWEQYDGNEMDLTPEACNRLAEDASYKLWELCNHLKIYSRRSNGPLTYDIVNAVLTDYDCPPALGAMDSDWERIDYDGAYFYHADKVLELRDEYQREERISIVKDIDIVKFQPIDDKYLESAKKYTINIMNLIIHGGFQQMERVLYEIAHSPLIGSILRVLLTKILHLLAFKQSDFINVRCWRVLKACSTNRSTRHIFYREELFHLSEILICQLLAPFESIKDLKGCEETPLTNGHDDKNQTESNKPNGTTKENHGFVESQSNSTLQMPRPIHDSPPPDIKPLLSQLEAEMRQDDAECKYVLDSTESDNEEETNNSQHHQYSGYFASPVEVKYVDQLCDTIGCISARCGVLYTECLHHIIRRLERFFQGRDISTDKDYNYIARAVKGLICLGECAFREFIPFFYKLNLDALPEKLCNAFVPAGMFVHNQEDFYLYECLAIICGADELQPFLTSYAHKHEQYLKYRIKRAKQATFNIIPKIGVRKIEWVPIRKLAPSNGEEDVKMFTPKPTYHDLFPEAVVPKVNLNRPGSIRFKFAGCRPIPVKSKSPNVPTTQPPATNSTNSNNLINPIPGVKIKSEPGEMVPIEILIARRKLYKPLTNGYKMTRLSNYYFLRL